MRSSSSSGRQGQHLGRRNRDLAVQTHIIHAEVVLNTGLVKDEILSLPLCLRRANDADPTLWYNFLRVLLVVMPGWVGVSGVLGGLFLGGDLQGGPRELHDVPDVGALGTNNGSHRVAGHMKVGSLLCLLLIVERRAGEKATLVWPVVAPVVAHRTPAASIHATHASGSKHVAGATIGKEIIVIALT